MRNGSVARVRVRACACLAQARLDLPLSACSQMSSNFESQAEERQSRGGEKIHPNVA